MRRGSVELSINFIIIVIISIVMLAFGLFFAKKMLWGADNEAKRMQDQISSQIEDMLYDQAALVSVPYTSKTVANGQLQIFGLRVMNTLTAGGATDTFLVDVQFDRAYDKSSNAMDLDQTDPNYPSNWIMTNFPLQSPISIAKHSDQKFGIGIKPKSASPGTYVYTVIIQHKNPVDETYSSYGNPIKLYVQLP